MLKERSSRGRRKLAFDLSSIDRNAFEDVRSRRCGHRKNAVSASDFAKTYMNGRDDHFVRRDLLHKGAEAYDISDRIHSSDFVEMDLGYIFAVCLALGSGNELIYCDGVCFDLVRDIEISDYVLYVVKRAVMVVMFVLMIVPVLMMVVLMHMFIFDGSVNGYIRMSARDTAFY